MYVCRKPISHLLWNLVNKIVEIEVAAIFSHLFSLSMGIWFFVLYSFTFEYILPCAASVTRLMGSFQMPFLQSCGLSVEEISLPWCEIFYFRVTVMGLKYQCFVEKQACQVLFTDRALPTWRHWGPVWGKEETWGFLHPQKPLRFIRDREVSGRRGSGILNLTPTGYTFTTRMTLHQGGQLCEPF